MTPPDAPRADAAQEQSVGEWGDDLVRQDAEKLAKLLAARDAAVWAQACEAAARVLDLSATIEGLIHAYGALAPAYENAARMVRVLAAPQSEGSPE